MKMMKAIQVTAKGEPMKLVEIPVPTPGEEQILIKVEFCGVCHGDAKVIEGAATSYPRIPGHEVVGIVETEGKKVVKRSEGWYRLARRSRSYNSINNRRRLCRVYGRL